MRKYLCGAEMLSEKWFEARILHGWFCNWWDEDPGNIEKQISAIEIYFELQLGEIFFIPSDLSLGEPRDDLCRWQA